MPFLIAVEKESFYNLPSLTDVSISNSKKLTFIHPKAFTKCPNLRTLNLADNALFTLGDLRPAVPNIKLIQLELVRKLAKLCMIYIVYPSITLLLISRP